MIHIKIARIAVAAATTLVLAGCATTSTSPPADTSTQPPDAVAPTAAPTAPPAPTTLFNLSGSGTKTSVNFTTPNEWTLAYTYDCSNAGGSGNFLVSENNADGSANLNGASVNELGAHGASTTAVHNDAGSHNLGIISECKWTVQVVG